jgi:hypothetical protein
LFSLFSSVGADDSRVWCSYFLKNIYTMHSICW